MPPIKLTYTIHPTDAMSIIRVLTDIESDFGMLPDKIEYDGKEYPFPDEKKEYPFPDEKDELIDLIDSFKP